MSTEPDNTRKPLDWLKPNEPLPGNRPLGPPPLNSAPPDLESADAHAVATGPLHSPNAVMIATFFGSPVAGAALMAINYRRLGDKRRSVMTLAGGVAASAALLAVGWVLPERFPSSPLAIGSIVAMRQLAVALQEGEIQRHKDRGGAMASKWRAVGVGLLALLVVAAVILAIVWVTEPGLGTRLAVSATEEIYYSDDATLADAKALAEKLKEVRYFGEGQPVSVFFSKNTSGVTVSFVVGEGSWNKAAVIAAYRRIGEEIAPAVGSPLRVRLVNDVLEVKKEITIK